MVRECCCSIDFSDSYILKYFLNTSKVYIFSLTVLSYFVLILEKATSVQMKPMQRPTRLILHTLAKFYNINSYEYDPEPNRYVSFVKLLDSRLPANLLSNRCAAKFFHRDLTIFQMPIDSEHPFTLSFCRRTLEPGEEPSVNFSYGTSQELKSGGGSRAENIPTLTSASELLLRIQLCNENKRLDCFRSFLYLLGYQP